MTARPKQCPKCGQPHAACAGHTRAGNACRNKPMHFQHVCRMHGGATPVAVKAAKAREQRAAALEAVATYGLPVDISPTEALLEEVRWTAGHVQWLRARVQELETALVWGVTRTETEMGGSLRVDLDDRGDVESVAAAPADKIVRTAGANIWLELYDRERKHLVGVCSAAIKAGVEERRVRLAESQGELVAGAIRAILADLGLSPEQEGRVGEVVPRHLRALAGGAA